MLKIALVGLTAVLAFSAGPIRSPSTSRGRVSVRSRLPSTDLEARGRSARQPRRVKWPSTARFSSTAMPTTRRGPPSSSASTPRS